MPKRKRSRSRDDDIESLKQKIRKLEKKYRSRVGRSKSNSPRDEEEVIHRADNIPATPTLQPEDWLSEGEITANHPVSTDENPNYATTSLVMPPTSPLPPLPQTDSSSATAEAQENSEAVKENIPDLDTDVLAILGDDPTKTIKYGPEIRNELANRLLHVVAEGLAKENRKDLMAKYPIPANCTHIDAPKINPEIKAAVPETTVKRDIGIENKQKQMVCAISGLSEVINTLLSAKEKNNTMLQKLIDTSRILCDIQHADSITRRNFILFGLKNDLKEHLKNTKIDTYLFSENLPETLKSAKAVNKSGVELKADSSNKAAVKTYKQPASKNLNRKPVSQARRPPVTPGQALRSCEPAAPRAPPRLPPPAHSSRTSSRAYQPPQQAPTYQRRRY